MLAFSVGGNSQACPTTPETATSFSNITSVVLFVNTSNATQTIYHGNSADTSAVIGSVLILPNERLMLWKRITRHKFWASSNEVIGTPGMAFSPTQTARNNPGVT